MNSHSIPIQSDSVRERLMSLEGLPPFPATASQILSECQKTDVNVQTVARLVEVEPAISSKVIQLANSPLYGATRPIVSINHAIVLLGFKSVSEMAISIAVGTVFEQGDPAVSKYRKQTFRQSLACAITARRLSTEMHAVSPDEAFLCGVMHDVGKLVLFDVVPEQYCEMLDGSETDDTTAEERLVFGVDHAELGKQCGIKWGFPTQIEVAIAYHHHGIRETTPQLAQAVIAGNYYSRQWCLADSTDVNQPEAPEIESLFAAADLETTKHECLEQFQNAIEICAA